MNPPIPPALSPPIFPDASPSPLKNTVARWRWWVFLVVIGSAPLLAALASVGQSGAKASGLPRTIPNLLLYCALEMATFGVLWAVAWAFSRADKDQLFTRWKDGWKPLAWGAFYSVALRLGLSILLVLVFVWLVMIGFKPEDIEQMIKKNQPDVGKLFLPALMNSDPLYRFLFITLISFVVAGLREELWRAATLAGLLHLAPKGWSQNVKNGVALGVSSVVFGMGHLYQGLMGVALTGVLGIGLGAIILRHRSIWPAVIAHGFFNAASFAALMLMGNNPVQR